MVALFALVSCEQTSYLYEPTNECLTFSANSGAWLFTDEPVIEFQLVRGVLNSDLTVNLNLSGDAGRRPFRRRRIYGHGPGRL